MKEEVVKLGISELEAKELIKVSKNVERDYKKLKKGYPIQYLIGYVNFYGLKIKINRNALIPRFETETLVEKTLKYLKKYNITNPNILDMCTGSGCIALALKKNINSSITATDINFKALRIAKENKKENKLDIKIKQSNLFSNISDKFDLIITNPPYVSTKEKLSRIVRFEPKKALYAKNKGNYYIKKIIHESKYYLNSKSILAMEINNYNSQTIKDYATKIYPNAIIKIEKDLDKKDRYLFIINE